MKLYAARILFRLVMPAGVLLLACMQGRDRPTPVDRAEGDPTDWIARLARRTYDGQPAGVLRDELGEAVKRDGRVVWGGTGNQSAYYLLADQVVVKADLDVLDRIIGEPVVGRVKEWPEASDGRLVREPEIYPQAADEE